MTGTDDSPLEQAGDGPFWSAARDGRLSLQHCADCGYVRWPAAGVCPECLSRSFTWDDVAGTGTVWSYVVYHRAYARTGIPEVPYNVALVELDCGARLLTRLAEPTDPGARVAVAFEEVPEHGLVPVFRPDPEQT
jgi:hypothetical protein